MAKMMHKGIMDKLMRVTGCHVEKDLADFTVEFLEAKAKPNCHLYYFNNMNWQRWIQFAYNSHKVLKFKKGGKVTTDGMFIDQNGNW